MGHEYIASHRAYRRLAVLLSDAGFNVLRFDFYGCGDSGGDCNEGHIRQWLTDISTAISELKRRCGFVKVCLVGFRLGGTMATMIGAERGDIAGMVLWDPVVSGRAYIEELTNLHNEMLQNPHAKPKRYIKGEKPTEIFGFPLTDFLLTDIENIDLSSIRQKPANNILLIETNEVVGERLLRKHLESIGAHFEHQHLPSPRIWMEDINKVLVPNKILRSVVSWMSRVYP
jgi:pimeloyl-ACP methyl ester carboxylesterase